MARAATIAAAAGMLMSATAMAQQGREVYSIINFEGIAEGTELIDQYQFLGVTFRSGRSHAYPIVATAGDPLFAFFSEMGLEDAPMPFGTGAMADPVIDGNARFGHDIDVYFDPPALAVRLFLADVDGAEMFYVSSYDPEGDLLDWVPVLAGGPDTGDGVPTIVTLTEPDIARVEIDAEERDGVGYAVDLITFSRPCPDGICGRLIDVMQESAPGAGDFEEHVLGQIRAFLVEGTMAEAYAWGAPHRVSWNGLPLETTERRSYVLFAQTFDGMSVVLVHDSVGFDDPEGGHAETRVTILGDEDGAVRTVEDDPPDYEGRRYTGDPGDSVFTADQTWGDCCTDGMAISGLNGPWSVLVEFTDTDGDPGTPAFVGIDEWRTHCSTDADIVFALEEGRRVMFRLACVADFNGDGRLDIFDFLAFQTAFGNEDPAADLAQPYGVLNIFDFLAFQTAYGNGCGE